jgi:hypothetical protein
MSFVPQPDHVHSTATNRSGPWHRRSARLVAALAALATVTGCDSPSSTSATAAPADTTADSSSPAPEVGLDAAPDIPVDARPPSVCELGCIPVQTSAAPRGVTFQQYPSGPPPQLAGGAGPTGDWVLRRVEIRPNATFANGIQVTLGNAGETAGRAAFGGDALAMAIDLHLLVTVTVLDSTGSDTARQQVALGGCHAPEGARLVGSLQDCAKGFPPGTSPPSGLDYQHDPAAGTLSLGLSLSREALIALLPEDQRETGQYVITGPLYLVAQFGRP